MSAPLRLLLVEDSDDDALLLLRALRRAGYEPDCGRADGEASMRRHLAAGPWDLVISDHSMPGFDALTALGLLREASVDVPFIIVSGAIGEETAVEAMAAGASDYVMKDNLARLAPAIERELAEAGERRARRAAEEQAHAWARIFETARWGVAVLAAEGAVIEHANAEFARMHGRSAQALAGLCLLDLAAPEARDTVGARLDALRAADHAVFQAIHLRDGERFPVELHVSAIPDAASAGTQLAVHVDDITERSRAEESLRRHAAILDSSFDAIYGQDVDGTITSWNPAAERIYGYRADEILGRSIRTLIPSERRHEMDDLVRRMHGGERVEQYETQRLTFDGRLIDVSLTISPIRGAAGEVAGVSTIARDITDRKRFQAQLQYLADHDPLTGLLNRRRFEQEVDHVIALADRYREPAALLLLDLDNFKYFNDTLGHGAGDELIRAVARALRGRVRESDVLARLGGDEFAVLLTHADAGQARAAAQKLLEAVRECSMVISGQRLRVTASVGVAAVELGATHEDLLAQADMAMYDAKDRGRNALSVYTPQDRDRFTARLGWEERIRGALAEDRFELHSSRSSTCAAGTRCRGSCSCGWPTARESSCCPARSSASPSAPD